MDEVEKKEEIGEPFPIEENKAQFGTLIFKKKSNLFIAAGVVLFIVLLPVLLYAQKNTSASKEVVTPSPSVTQEKDAVESVPSISHSVSQSASPTPTKTVTPKKVAPSPTPIPLPTHTPIPTPTPTPKDTLQPQLISVIGIDEGATYSFPNTCIPIRISDNVSSFSNLVSRMKLDDSSWPDWDHEHEKCYSFSNGQHTLHIEIRDEAGNVGSYQRHFTIQY